MDIECVREGCERPVAVKKLSLCKSHAITHYRKEKTIPCNLEWCEKVQYAKGLCASHYERQRQGLPLIDPRIPKPPCLVEGCDHESHTKGYCRTHYMYQWAGMELKPIRRYKVEMDGEDKLCKTCGIWKNAEDEFYKRTGGTGYQPECKPCHIKRGSERQARKKLERQGLLNG